MRRILILWALGVVSGGCTPMPPSAPHPLLEQTIRWPALRRSCGAEDKDCQTQKDGAFEVEHQRRVVEFWSPNCPPCRERLLELCRRRNELQSRGWSVALVAVLESDECESSAMNKLQEWGLLDSSWVLSQADSTRLGIHGLPSLWLVSSQQRLRWVAPPRATIDDIIVAVERI